MRKANDPMTCPHAVGEVAGHVACDRGASLTYVACREGVCGEPPACAWEEPDNSPEAMGRRLAWMREHE